MALAIVAFALPTVDLDTATGRKPDGRARFSLDLSYAL